MSALAVEMLPVRRRFSRDLSRPKPRACRNLFGTPDRNELDRCSEMIATQLRNIQEEERAKYNFDFVNDNPLDGQYEWTSSDPQDIPSFYRPVNITHAKRLPRRTCPSLGSEASNVAEQVRSNTSVLPVDLQARLIVNTSRTDEVEDLGATSASATPNSTTVNSTKSSTKQQKITDFLRHRKRSPERSLDEVSTIRPKTKRQRADTMDTEHHLPQEHV